MKSFYNRALGSNNILGGKVAHYASSVRYFFNPVTREIPVTYTSTCTYTQNGSPVIKQFTRTETLKPASSTAIVRGQARLELFDKTSNEALKDVSITLQKENGNNWENVERQDRIGASYQTEKKALKGYTFVKDSGNTEGTYKEDAIEVVYTYKKNKYKIETEVVNGEIDKGYEIEYGDTIKVEYEKENKSILDIPKTLHDIMTYVLLFGGSIIFIGLIVLGINKTKNKKKGE